MNKTNAEKPLSKKISLRYKVISLFTIAIVLPSLLFGVVVTSIGKQTLRESIFYRQQEIVSRIADRINFQIEMHSKSLNLRADINRMPQKQKKAYLNSILKDGKAFSQIGIYDANMKEIASVRKKDFSGKQKSRPNQYVFKNNISGVIFEGNESPYVFLKAPLLDKCSLVAKFDFGQLWKWMEEVKIGKAGLAFIVDKKGNLIAHKEQERVLAGSNFSELPVVKDFISGVESSPKRWREYFDERGQKVAALYKEIPKLEWAVVAQVPSKEVYQPVSDMNRSIFIWTVFWISVFLLIGLSFVRKIVDPLAVLSSGAEKISRGDLDIKLDIRTGDELENLAQNFEKMALELKKLETMKEDLTRMIIHDLKSPLAGIMGGLDYLNLGYSGELTEEQKKMTELAKKSCENMSSMVQNLLDIAKMEEGKLQLNRENVNMRELLQSRHSEFKIQAENEQKELSLNLDESLPQITAEKNLIERVMNNLISNAIKHTLSGGTIKISAMKDNALLKVSITDNGAGIPEEFKEIIFEKFVQIERKKSQLRTGAGLGLTFCKMVIEAHGGDIWVESELDKGSSFIFTLPL